MAWKGPRHMDLSEDPCRMARWSVDFEWKLVPMFQNLRDYYSTEYQTFHKRCGAQTHSRNIKNIFKKKKKEKNINLKLLVLDKYLFVVL